VILTEGESTCETPFHRELLMKADVVLKEPSDSVGDFYVLKDRRTIPEIIPVLFDLYKASGNWAYGGVAMIEHEKVPAHSDLDVLLPAIDEGQDMVVKGLITRREYTLVLRDDPILFTCPEYRTTYNRLVPAISVSLL
jgi:hypothetical protein